MKRRKENAWPPGSILYLRLVRSRWWTRHGMARRTHMTRWKEAFSRGARSLSFAQTAPSAARPSDMGNISVGTSAVSLGCQAASVSNVHKVRTTATVPGHEPPSAIATEWRSRMLVMMDVVCLKWLETKVWEKGARLRDECANRKEMRGRWRVTRRTKKSSRARLGRQIT